MPRSFAGSDASAEACPHRHPYRSRRLGVVFVGECVGRGVQLADGSWALPDLTPAPIGQR